MSTETTIIDTVDPELAEGMARRTALRRGAAGLVAAASGVGFAAMVRDAYAQGGGLPKQAVDVLNFALTLEYLEAEFYKQGNETAGLIPEQDQQIFQTIGEHENQHVDFLKETLGSKAAKKPAFDFTAGGAFDPFENYETFRLLSIAFEDTGVRAYKGQAIIQAAKPLLANPKLLTAALTIHSVEGRHAARVRQLLGFTAWIPGDFSDAPKPVQPVYATDQELANKVPAFDVTTTTVFGVDLTDVSDASEQNITEAYDEPLGMDAVLKIAGMFIKS